MAELKVLIVGASIAGPMAAYWFAKAGAQVTVIERFPELRTSGQAIDIRTVGVTIMNKIPGMEAAVRSKTTTMEGIHLLDSNGRTVAKMKATGDPDQQSLVSEYEIFRGDLSKILYDLSKDRKNVEYVFGEQVTAINQTNDQSVDVDFANGMPSQRYNLVVACDGTTSRTRAIGFGCGVRDHMESLNTWTAHYSIKKDLLEGSKIGQGWASPGGRFLTIGPDPTGINRAGLLSVHSRNRPEAILPFRKAQKEGTEAIKKLAIERFRPAGFRVNELIEGIMDSDDFYASEIARVRVPSLYRGRFVLVGDAGYSPSLTGTGTSLAMVGAYLLAGEINKHKGDLAAGLAGYEARMRPIMKDLQKLPPGMPGIIAPQSAWVLWLRNLVFKILMWLSTFGTFFGPILRLLGSLFASSFAKDKYGIPDYDWPQ